MGTRVTIGDYSYEVNDFSVSESASPLAAGDTSGSVGNISFSFATPDMIDKKISVLIEDPNNPGFMMEVT